MSLVLKFLDQNYQTVSTITAVGQQLALPPIPQKGDIVWIKRDKYVACGETEFTITDTGITIEVYLVRA